MKRIIIVIVVTLAVLAAIQGVSMWINRDGVCPYDGQVFPINEGCPYMYLHPKEDYRSRQ